MTERSTKPALTTTSAEELDANFYMNKLRTIRANCGLENTDVSIMCVYIQYVCKLLKFILKPPVFVCIKFLWFDQLHIL